MAKTKSMKNKSRRRRGQRGGFSLQNTKKYFAVDSLKKYHENGDKMKVQLLMKIYNKDDYLISPESLEVCGDELFTEYMDNLKYIKDNKLIPGHAGAQVKLFYDDLLKTCGKSSIRIDGGRRRRTHKK